jgi:hypothetical protein
MLDAELQPVSDGSASSEKQGEDSPGSWRAHERVDERYREPEDPDPFDIEPEIPEAPDPSDNEVDPELSRRFWALVVLFDAALLATALGLMIAVFEGDTSLGGQLFLAGAAVFAFGVYRYRTTRARIDERNG